MHLKSVSILLENQLAYGTDHTSWKTATVVPLMAELEANPIYTDNKCLKEIIKIYLHD